MLSIMFLMPEVENHLDLNTHFIKKPAATFFVRASGEGMRFNGIHNGDLLIVDRSRHAEHRSLILAVIQGEFAIRRFLKQGMRKLLSTDHPRDLGLEITPEMEFEVWGVIAHVIHTPT